MMFLQSILIVAQLTVTGAGGREPMLQTDAVHHRQWPGTLAGRQQIPRTAALMTDTTERLISGQTEEKETEV